MDTKWVAWGVLLGTLVLVFLLFDGPVAASSTVAGTLCTDPGDYDPEDVRIRYDQSTMIGAEGVEIRGTQVYSIDETTGRGNPRSFGTGTISRARLNRLIGLIARTGVFCLADQYRDRFILPLSEPVYEDLTMSIGGESRTISITSTTGRGGSARVRRVINEARTIGQSLPPVGGIEFCDRTPPEAVDAISTYCEYQSNVLDREDRSSTLDREEIERWIHYRINVLRTDADRSRLERTDRLDRIARSHSREMARREVFASGPPTGITSQAQYTRPEYECKAETVDPSSAGAENVLRKRVDRHTFTNGQVGFKSFEDWRNISRARESMFRRGWENTGVGVYIVTDEDKTTVYVTQIFCD